MFLVSSSAVCSLKVARPKHFLSRLAVPIGLIVVNTFMMSTSAKGTAAFCRVRSQTANFIYLSSYGYQ